MLVWNSSKSLRHAHVGVLKTILYGLAPPRGPNPYPIMLFFLNARCWITFFVVNAGSPHQIHQPKTVLCELCGRLIFLVHEKEVYQCLRSRQKCYYGRRRVGITPSDLWLSVIVSKHYSSDETIQSFRAKLILVLEHIPCTAWRYSLTNWKPETVKRSTTHITIQWAVGFCFRVLSRLLRAS